MSFWSWLKDKLSQPGSFDGSLVLSNNAISANSAENSHQHTENNGQIGKLSKKYEVGPRGSVGTISSGKGDPGGKSYGLWQLASKTGTLDAFVKQSKYRSKLSKYKTASAPFDVAWKLIAKEDPQGFEQDQYNFIKKTHFDPIYALWKANNMVDHPVIQEVLWSIGVQHGKAKTIVSNAIQAIKVSLGTKSVEFMVKTLYDFRRKYVRGFMQGALLQSLLNRYNSEEKDAVEMLKGV